LIVIPGRERKLANPESSNHLHKIIATEGYWIPDRRFAASGMTE
jgi:hypothetical protein